MDQLTIKSKINKISLKTVKIIKIYKFDPYTKVTTYIRIK